MTKGEKENSLIIIISRLEKRYESALNLDRRFSYYRFIIFIAGIVSTLLLFFYTNNTYTFISILVFITIFAVVAHLHSRLTGKIKRLKNWIEIKKTHIARMKLDWDNIPKYESADDKTSAIERDLNITGEKSLLHLISICTTKAGTDILRSLLSITQPEFEKIIKRQKLVKELSLLGKFRDKLLLASIPTKTQQSTFNFNEWLHLKKSLPQLKKIVILFSVWGFMNLFFILADVFSLLSSYYWITSILAYYAFSSLLAKKVSGSYKDADIITEQVARYTSVFDFIEKYKYKKESDLEKFVSRIIDAETRPSKFLNKINKYIEILSMRKNPFLWGGMVIVFPMDFYVGYRIEECKQKISIYFNEWMNIWYQLEAYCSLANFASLNPDYTFPEIKKELVANESILSAAGIGHPLLPEEIKIRNDFTIQALQDVYIFTGSNMSGKSTFLRTVGLNILLAYSGAPVDSKSFFVHLIKLFTCINVTDSVVDGISYFYAEVKRLKELLEKLNETNQLPLFFLIDEIFKGTNNVERLKGSQAYVRKLIEENAAGIIATHDLELTKLAQENSKVKNFHFREDIKDGKMKFNYQLYTGPCPTTNALKIMEMEGLPI